MATLANTEQDQHTIEAVLAGLERPNGVRAPEILFTRDHSGEEAVYITFPSSKRLGQGTERVRELNMFVQAVENGLTVSGLSHFPYVWLRESR